MNETSVTQKDMVATENNFCATKHEHAIKNMPSITISVLGVFSGGRGFQSGHSFTTARFVELGWYINRDGQMIEATIELSSR